MENITYTPKGNVASFTWEDDNGIQVVDLSMTENHEAHLQVGTKRFHITTFFGRVVIKEVL